MTDKQTIINNVDVSGCEYCLKMTKYRCIIQRDVYKCLCEENPNCYYKQLQREKQNSQEARDTAIKEFNKAEELKTLLKSKEQECEALKEEIKTNGFGCFNIEMSEQLDQLEKSNEGLQKENKRLNMELAKVYEDIKLSPLCYKCDEEECLRKEIDKLKAEKEKLKQDLIEIKPILEFYANSSMGEEQPDKTYHISLNGGYIMVYDPKPARQALQKISECEVEK